MKFITGIKLGMTRVFDEGGKAVAVTAVSTKPLKVKALLEESKVGYSAVMTEESEGDSYEFRVANVSDYKEGQDITIDQFESGDKVTVVGKTKGKGFSGVIKRHGFGRGPETHGSDHHRKTGAIGGAYPQRVVKGKKMPGQLGGRQATVKNLEVVDVDKDNNVMLIAGAIPGPKKSHIRILSK